MQQLAQRYIAVKRRMFKKIYGKKLNRWQYETVFTVNGPLLVLAGAGSGKTTVLVNRIAYLIKYGDAYFTEHIPEDLTKTTVEALEYAEENLPEEEITELLGSFTHMPAAPWSVLAITFTNKAAREIKERLTRALSDSGAADAVWSGTFHSVCLRILRKFGDRLGYREGFSIYDTDDKRRMLSLCMGELGIDEKRLGVKAVANAISMAKDRLVGPSDYPIDGDPRAKDIIAIYKLYQHKMMEYNALDFDDIIMRTVQLLEREEDVRNYYQRKFKYVLVDEYQDTNHAQFVLTKLLSDGYRNIMVVGDDDQSIYAFRGATVENILDFDKNYPDAKVVKLEQNYRSTETILNAANAVICNNDKRHQKKLWCDKGEGEKILLIEAQNQHEEGKLIIDKIISGVNNEGRKYSDFAVLFRINELARSLETSFAKSGIPYRILGGLRFYDRKEIKDIIAYLVLLVSDNDNLRLKRIINEPKRKIGDATLSAIEGIAGSEGVPMLSVVRRAGEYTSLSKSAERLLAFAAMIDRIRAMDKTPSELISAVFDESGYCAMLEAEGFEGEGKIANVREFISAAVEYEHRLTDKGDTPTLVGFLEEISLVSDVDKYDENADAVVLMTIHSAKGLEFPSVFLAGMEDGIFPSQQNLFDKEAMSEERRLAYVAITRAKERLYITYSADRILYGRSTKNRLSQFVREELPKNLMTVMTPKRKTPHSSYTGGSAFGSGSNFGGSGSNFGGSGSRGGDYMRELRRPPAISNPRPAVRGAAGFGVEKLAVGTRVSHPLFGVGTVVSAKDMGGDVLYEVRFDSGESKRLMATYAKLTKI